MKDEGDEGVKATEMHKAFPKAEREEEVQDTRL